MSPELLGALMLVLMLGAIFIGFPISFTLLLLALIFGWVGLGDRAFYIMVFQTIGLMKEEVLAAVPLFIFMGYLMEQGGLMERLFKGFQLMMGPVPVFAWPMMSWPERARGMVCSWMGKASMMPFPARASTMSDATPRSLKVVNILPVGSAGNVVRPASTSGARPRVQRPRAPSA